MAPAAQMLAMPNWALRRAISQARAVTMRPPVADQGCPTRKIGNLKSQDPLSSTTGMSSCRRSSAAHGENR